MNDDDYDPDEDPERVMYEPVDMDDCALTNIVKEIAQKIIHKEIHDNKPCMQCETKCAQSDNQAENSEATDKADIRCMIDDFIEMLKAQNQVFEDVYEKAIVFPL